MVDRITGSTYSGVSGQISISDEGERMRDFVLKGFDFASGEFDAVIVTQTVRILALRCRTATSNHVCSITAVVRQQQVFASSTEFQFSQPGWCLAT